VTNNGPYKHVRCTTVVDKYMYIAGLITDTKLFEIGLQPRQSSNLIMFAIKELL